MRFRIRAFSLPYCATSRALARDLVTDPHTPYAPAPSIPEALTPEDTAQSGADWLVPIIIMRRGECGADQCARRQAPYNGSDGKTVMLSRLCRRRENGSAYRNRGGRRDRDWVVLHYRFPLVFAATDPPPLVVRHLHIIMPAVL